MMKVVRIGICGLFAVAVIASILFRAGHVMAPPPSPAAPPVVLTDEVRALLPRIVTMDPPKPSDPYTVVAPLDADDQRRLEPYLHLLKLELAVYPEGFHQRQGLDEVILVKSIRVLGQERGALPDPTGHRLFFNPFLGDYNRTYQRHCVHHEYFHFLMERWHSTPYYFDREWTQFDPAAKYGTGGFFQRNSNSAVLNHPAPGFVDGYAASAPEEDMAEVYAALMTHDEQALMRGFAGNDPVLTRKIDFMRAHYLPGAVTPRP